MLNIRSEREERLSESVPLDASPQVHVVADAMQKDTLVEGPSSPLPRESSVQTDTRSGPRSLNPLPLKKHTIVIRIIQHHHPAPIARTT